MENIHLYISILIFLASTTKAYENVDMVKVAVYEHNVTIPPFTLIPVSRDQAVDNMMINLRVMQRQAEIAKAQGAKLIVFPEDGIYGFELNRRTIYPYLEYIPDPKQKVTIPCTDLSNSRTEVQNVLSCLARKTSMYIVANMGDCQPCNKTTDQKCPVDGHYQYNTDVVFDPLGVLIARYHKYNLFHEAAFDTPLDAEIITFTTPFGTFGVFTCFDILFHNPAVEIVQKQGVRNVVFPTAWFDALPLLSAIGFHSAFAARWQVNLLAANIHIPNLKAQGSGIYSTAGSTAYIYDTKDTNGHLLVSSIPILKQSNTDSSHTINWHRSPKTTSKQFNKDKEFESYVFHDLFNFVTITGSSGTKSICQNDICCNVVYNKTDNTDELYAFGAFDGLHTYQGRYYLQVCTMLKCKTTDYKSCGDDTTEADTDFNYLEITSNSLGYIYPEVMLSDAGMLALSKQWYLSQDMALVVKNGLEKPLLSASLISRVYNKD